MVNDFSSFIPITPTIGHKTVDKYAIEFMLVKVVKSQAIVRAPCITLPIYPRLQHLKRLIKNKSVLTYVNVVTLVILVNRFVYVI